MSKTILITGGAGFIAHHLVEKVLKETDWKIVSIDRLDYSGNLNRLNEVVMSFPEIERKRVKVIHHDLKAAINPQIISMIGKIDLIAHLAASSHVDRSIKYPMEFVLDNVVGTVNLMDYARNLDSLDLFVYFSTDEIFGPAPHGIKYKENDRYNSTNPYSASKAAGEEMVVAYENTYGLPSIITHTMNVFGERQHPEKYIPMCIKKIRDNETVTIHADATKTIPGSRHYLHAKDVADALLFLYNLNKSNLELDYGGARCQKFNIVGETEIDNLKLAQFVSEVQGKTLNYELVDFHSSRPGHDLRYALDGEKMTKLGWKPKPAHKQLEEVVNWSLINSTWLI